MTPWPDTADVALLITCRNERAALAWLLPRVPEGIEVVLCDNGSVDGSPSFAADLGASVVTEGGRRRVGAAIRKGVESTRAPIIAVIDGDGTVDPQDLVALVEPIRSGAADVVLGARLPNYDSRFFPRLMTGTRNCLFRAVTTTHATDLGTARAFSRAALAPNLPSLNERFAWNLSSTLSVIRESGPSRMACVPIPHHVRIGRSQISGSLVGSIIATADSLLVLSRFIWGRRPAPSTRDHQLPEN